MSKTTDITIIGNGGSVHASERTDGFIPFSRVADLFDFDVHFTKVYVPAADGVAEVPNKSAIVNATTGSVYNVVSKRYAIHQFRDVLLDNVSSLLDTSSHDLGIVGAGLLDEGAVGWVQVAPSEGVTVNGDTVLPTLTVVSSHNGKFATSYRTGLFRFACSNQIGALRRSTGNVYRMKHTKNSRLRLTDARDTLGLMFADAAAFTEDMVSLMNTSVTDREFLSIVERLNPKPEMKVTDGEVSNEAAITRWQNRHDHLWEMWREDERVGFRGTAWGALQTFSTYSQNDRSYRGMNTVTRAGRTMGALLAGQVDRSDLKVLDTIRKVKASA